MITKDKVPRRKPTMPEMANEMSNVSRGCRIMGYSRQLSCDIRGNYRTYWAD